MLGWSAVQDVTGVILAAIVIVALRDHRPACAGTG
jgi:hypothetical protein